MHERKYEVRTFMPQFGAVNERRNQLHEVIRLSGLNIPVGDVDYPVQIKVASMQPSRIQVYFVYNEDVFSKEETDADIAGTNRADNDDRSIFFAHGALTTAVRLGWIPALVQCTGWITALSPLYIRRRTEGEPMAKTKIVYTVMPGDKPTDFNVEALLQKLKSDGIPAKDLEMIKSLPADTALLDKIGILYADGVVFATPEMDPELKAFTEKLGLPSIAVDIQSDETANKLQEFYNTLLSPA